VSEHVSGDPGSDLLVDGVGSRPPKNMRGNLSEVDIDRKVFSAGSDGTPLASYIGRRQNRAVARLKD
jgi:hypothetical protein